MALIDCPECNSPISDQSETCIKCGFPTREFFQNNIKEKELNDYLETLNGDLNFEIGSQVVNWGGDAAIKGEATFEYGELGQVEPGKVEIIRHDKGIKIVNSAMSSHKDYSISYRQMLDVCQIPAQELVREEKSVIGRGVVGGVLLGGAGAVVGALSGLDKDKLKKLTITEIYFYDPNRNEIRIIVFRSQRAPSLAFFRKVDSERLPESEYARRLIEDHPGLAMPCPACAKSMPVGSFNCPHCETTFSKDEIKKAISENSPNILPGCLVAIAAIVGLFLLVN
ncbi:hypothetical protein [Altererythrobacter rubellus]|uniref:Zinc ribbon domain-containing protein n=1 Tax=Altererythrobacter rubellus TaxID=2173831 RepID=A0A9Y2F6S9_9SPHN|nr:hypothetical protein [Altererythrobacter rubellus]WIW96177.1 hypothetical protein QQX03_03465 [Altererythrobacter rubellus]